MKHLKFLLSLLLLAVAPLAANDNYLKIESPEIKGDSVQDRYEDQLEVVSYGFGIFRGRNELSPPGPIQAQELYFTAFVGGKALPRIVQSVAEGTRHGKLILSGLRRFRDKSELFSEITLEGAYFTSVNLSGSSGDQPVYQFSVNYDKITIKTIPIDPRTGEPASPVIYTYDRTNPPK